MKFDIEQHLFDENTKSRRQLLYSGATKTVFAGKEEDTCILHFNDNHPLDAKAIINGKGVLNNRLCAYFYEHLNLIGVPTHFMEQLNMREQLVHQVERFHFYIDVHNYACDDFVERFKCQDNIRLDQMVVELRYKNKEQNDPVVSPQHMVAFGLNDDVDFEYIYKHVQRANDFLLGQFFAKNLALMRYKLEFGYLNFSEYLEDSRLVLVDEISLDTARVMDLRTNQRLDVLNNASISTSEISAPDLENAAFGYYEIAKRFDLIKTQSIYGDGNETDEFNLNIV